MENDITYMARAIELAEKGRGFTSPNPLVGAVIVNKGKILGEGYHQCYGMAHAEVNALLDAKNRNEQVEGATIYVTLEPCAHYGKTPPCALAIVKSGIKRVVIGILDPNPLVSGKGIKILQDAGIEVTTGILEKECQTQNEVFLKFITTKLPFVVMKSAMTLDGKIASCTGNSKWVTSEASRAFVQKIRGSYRGIMAGINTVLKDNPFLTARIPGARNPIRIVVDSHLQTPLTSNVFAGGKESGTIIAAGKITDMEKKEKLSQYAEILELPDPYGRVDLNRLMIRLGELKIDSILLEGGGTLNFSALETGIVDKVLIFIAPKLIGGQSALTPVEGNGIPIMKDAFPLTNMEATAIGSDLLITAYTERNTKTCLQELQRKLASLKK